MKTELSCVRVFLSPERKPEVSLKNENEFSKFIIYQFVNLNCTLHTYIGLSNLPLQCRVLYIFYLVRESLCKFKNLYSFFLDYFLG